MKASVDFIPCFNFSTHFTDTTSFFFKVFQLVTQTFSYTDAAQEESVSQPARRWMIKSTKLI